MPMTMNATDLKQAIPESESDACAYCLKETRTCWQVSEGLKGKLEFLGELEGEDMFGYKTYGGQNAGGVVSLSYYPYNGASAYRCLSCGAVFCIYLETGGHWAKDLVRWMTVDLEYLP